MKCGKTENVIHSLIMLSRDPSGRMKPSLRIEKRKETDTSANSKKIVSTVRPEELSEEVLTQ